MSQRRTAWTVARLIQILAALPDRPERVGAHLHRRVPAPPALRRLGELEPEELASPWPVRAPDRLWRWDRERGVLVGP